MGKKNVMRQTRFVIVFSIISILSIFSIISSIYVCLSILCSSLFTTLKHNSMMHYQYKHSLMINIIFWICITDALLGLRCVLLIIPQIFMDPNDWFYGKYFYGRYNGIMCDILSIVDIYFRIQNSLWHIILAYNFLYLLRLKDLEKLMKQKKYHYFVVILVRSGYVLFCKRYNKYNYKC